VQLLQLDLQKQWLRLEPACQAPFKTTFGADAPPGTRLDLTAGKTRKEEGEMLYYAIIFFVVALIAAVLGMRGVAGLSAEIGYLLVGVAVIFMVIALLTGRAPSVGP
jgi:uncharacterized membrane protein YtjA (UPF0391 family)